MYTNEVIAVARRKKSVPERHDGIRAAIYLRVSTEEQARSGLGIEAQRDRAMAALRLRDWEFIGEYADEGISGAKDEKKRPGLARLLADCEAGRVDAVVFLDLSRLGRRTLLILDLVDRLAKMDVQLVSCKENMDTSTAMGKAMLGFIAVLAQMERDLASERTRAALAEAGKRTGDKGGGVPYGYRRISSVIMIDESEASVVRQIFLWHSTGASLREVAFCLQDRGVPPRGGDRWHHSAIQCILANEAAYRGGNRDKSEARWPVILDEDLPGRVRPLAS